MDKTRFSAFKYGHGDAISLPPVRFYLALALAGSGLMMLFWLPPFGGVLLVAAVVLYLSRAGMAKLFIGPRYLICGNRILYYSNIDQITCQPGVLTLQSSGGKPLLIREKNFPTNARKTDKIARNKAAKFKQVSEKIIAKVRQAAPHVPVIGQP